MALNCAGQQLTGKNGNASINEDFARERGARKRARSEWQRRVGAARARRRKDISHVDAYSSTHCGLVLLWHLSELHCQQLVHSHRGPSLGGETIAAQAWSRHGDHGEDGMIGRNMSMVNTAFTMSYMVWASRTLRWTAWLVLAV
jgi:hypothetical protein